jgi:ubiquitin C-terminal hydrolase
MTKEIGEDHAKEVGDIHEKCNPNPLAEKTMDQHNNQKGRDYGKVPYANCELRCLSGVADGTLMTSPPP